jgi:hypothetical protein
VFDTIEIKIQRDIERMVQGLLPVLIVYYAISHPMYEGRLFQLWGCNGNFTKRILPKCILMKRILTKRILTQCILTLNIYSTKTYTNIPGFSLSVSSYFSSLQQIPNFMK